MISGDREILGALARLISKNAKITAIDNNIITIEIHNKILNPNLQLVKTLYYVIDKLGDYELQTLQISGDKVKFLVDGKTIEIITGDLLTLLDGIVTYRLLNVKDKKILDIGAYVGDTAVIFLTRGAKQVTAVEPSPWAYEMAKINLLNYLDRTILLKCAIDKDSNKVYILPDSITSRWFYAQRSKKGNVKVFSCTLDSLMEKYGPFDILKMDCEGCEYDSIPYSKRLKDFKETLIEYHNGYEILEEKLRNEGFKIQFLREDVYDKLFDKPLNPKLGYIYAVKQ
ncbi:MAG: FkbM family methyltransferase [Nanopusillaceae archaeon]